MDTIILDSTTFVGIMSIAASVTFIIGGALGYYTGVQDRPHPRRRRVGRGRYYVKSPNGMWFRGPSRERAEEFARRHGGRVVRDKS